MGVDVLRTFSRPGREGGAELGLLGWTALAAGLFFLAFLLFLGTWDQRPRPPARAEPPPAAKKARAPARPRPAQDLSWAAEEFPPPPAAPPPGPATQAAPAAAAAAPTNPAARPLDGAEAFTPDGRDGPAHLRQRPAGPHGKAAADEPLPEHPAFGQMRAGAGLPPPWEVCQLVRRLVRPEDTAYDKARAIYLWITANIEYGWDEWRLFVERGLHSRQLHDPLTVLARRKTICVGYAWLFHAMARAAGLEAAIVCGRARGFRGTPDEDMTDRARHAWNAVKIEENWALLDATWGARQPDENDDSFDRRRDYYFLTRPRQLIYDHLPDDSAWQLLETPVPREAFLTLPHLKPAYFRNRLKLDYPQWSGITTHDAAHIRLAAPQEVALDTSLRLWGTGKDLMTNVVATNTLLRGAAATNAAGTNATARQPYYRSDITVQPPHQGVYLFRLYARNTNSVVPYECSLDYIIVRPPDHASGAPGEADGTNGP